MTLRKMRFLLPLLTCIAITAAFPALAANYLVTGTTDVNGTYQLTERTQDGKPVYSNGTHDLAYISSGYWQIQPKGDAFTCLYYSYATSATPPIGDYDGDSGADWTATVAEAAGDPDPEITFSEKAFLETDANDGTIAPTPLVITLANDSFTGDANSVFDTSKVSVTNLPAGLTATITKTGETTLSFVVAGTTTPHDTDISDVTVSFTAEAFTKTDDIQKVTGAVTDDLTIDFLRSHTVGVNQDFTTVQAAISGADARDILLLSGTFTESELTIDKALTLASATETPAIIQAFSTKPDTANKRIFTIEENASVTFQNLILQNSVTTAKGAAAIYNKGTLRLTGCLFRNLTNAATSSYNAMGGAIYNTGALTCKKSGFTTASCTYSSSKGGAIYHYGKDLHIEDTTISGNQAGSGGGIFIQDSDNPVVIQNVTMAQNQAVKSGGALYQYRGKTDLSHATITQNTANLAGSSSDAGGGIYATSNADISLCAVVMAANKDAGEKGHHNIHGTVTSKKGNCIATIDGATGITHGSNGDHAGTNIAVLDTGLSPVAENGFYHLLAQSPAIENAIADTAPEKDQMGQSRIGTPDSGALEYLPAISGTVVTTIAGHTDLPVRAADVRLGDTAHVVSSETGFFRLPIAAALSGDNTLSITSPGLDTKEKAITLTAGKGMRAGKLVLTQTAIATQEEVNAAIANATEGLFTQDQVNTQVNNAVADKEAEMQQALAAKDQEKEKAISDNNALHAADRAALLRKFDVDGDGKVGLENVINALEVVAGIRQEASAPSQP